MSLHSPNKILARLTVNVKMSSETATLVSREKYESKNKIPGRRDEFSQL